MMKHYYYDYGFVSRKLLIELLGREEIQDFCKRADEALEKNMSRETYSEKIYGHDVTVRRK